MINRAAGFAFVSTQRASSDLKFRRRCPNTASEEPPADYQTEFCPDGARYDRTKSGFPATGSVPPDRQIILSKLPRENVVVALLEEVFENNRFGSAEPSPVGKRKESEVEYGRSITADGIATEERLEMGRSKGPKETEAVKK
ncbi:hypothetical protein JTB14_017071 [Gonioctena quinquepunctata]|nr:hypothetical protein JTB14_017071 [Gonioctena quinquepunctata]